MRNYRIRKSPAGNGALLGVLASGRVRRVPRTHQFFSAGQGGQQALVVAHLVEDEGATLAVFQPLLDWLVAADGKGLYGKRMPDEHFAIALGP